jgi:dTDP-4-dehydrorhamnose reductase
MALFDSILVTGGRGMLAHALDVALKRRGHSPVLASRADCDVAEPAQVTALFKRLRPTMVLNCAAYTKVDQAEKEPDQADRANGEGPRVLADACRRSGAALVHFSTDYVFDGSSRRPWRPDDAVNPQGAYGRSKLLGERAIQQSPPARWLVLRTAWLYGPNGPNFVQTMLNVARAGKSLKVVNDQVGSPTYTMDLAEATLDLLDCGAKGVYHVANAGQTSWFDFARAIFEEWGLSPDLKPTTSAEWKATKPDSATRPAYSVLDLEPLERILGRPMRPWREGLRAYRSLDRAPLS